MSDRDSEIPRPPSEEEMDDLSYDEAIISRDIKPELKKRIRTERVKAFKTGDNQVIKSREGILRGMKDTRDVPPDEFPDHVDNIIGIEKPPKK